MDRWACEIEERPTTLYRAKFGCKVKYFRRKADIFQWCVKQVMLKVFDEFEPTAQIDQSYWAGGEYYERISEESIHFYWDEVKRKALGWAKEGGYDFAETKIREYLTNELELPGRLIVPDENVPF